MLPIHSISMKSGELELFWINLMMNNNVGFVLGRISSCVTWPHALASLCKPAYILVYTWWFEAELAYLNYKRACVARDTHDGLLWHSWWIALISLGNNFRNFPFYSKQGVGTHGIFQNYLKWFLCIRVYSFVPLLYSTENGHRSVVKMFGLKRMLWKLLASV